MSIRNSKKKLKNPCVQARSCFYENTVECTSGLIVCKSTYPLKLIQLLVTSLNGDKTLLSLEIENKGGRLCI